VNSIFATFPKENYITRGHALLVFEEQCDLETTAMDDMLLFFNDIGRIVYHKEKKLREIVILKPSWLFDTMASILYVPPREGHIGEGDRHFTAFLIKMGRDVRKNNPAYVKLYEGILDQEYMNNIWADYPNCREVMKNLLLMYDLVFESYANPGKYIVPSLLPDKEFSESDDKWCGSCFFEFWEKKEESGSCSLYTFMPPRLWTRLLSRVWKDSHELQDQKGEGTYLFRSSARFRCYSQFFELCYDKISARIEVSVIGIACLLSCPNYVLSLLL